MFVSNKAFRQLNNYFVHYLLKTHLKKINRE